jgi:hypothetical protein
MKVIRISLPSCRRRASTSSKRWLPMGGYDDLPAEVLEAFHPALVGSLKARGARGSAHRVEGLLRESKEVAQLAAKAGPRQRELLAAKPR